jgi:hypothetical protein
VPEAEDRHARLPNEGSLNDVCLEEALEFVVAVAYGGKQE